MLFMWLCTLCQKQKVKEKEKEEEKEKTYMISLIKSATLISF